MKVLGIAAIVLALALTGCGNAPAGSSGCIPAVLLINPTTATADHLAAAPGNQQQFYEAYGGGTCAIPQIAVEGPLTSSDPIHVTVDDTGLATCVGATSGAVTLSSARTTATAQLTCK
ncbi:hypothetical protein SAMN05421770_10492 [Granulicella rosea]|uniref:Ig-like domain-containing protein n=1 Tax=Granulicella rosea TaxID=474952 RepID=A0A239JRM3_9BACT|nr:hypothetical protein [Granulicella rosea]SNT08465.1 hypothetical protein SAMN05421770_10492 [Granulicella rosea]